MIINCDLHFIPRCLPSIFSLRISHQMNLLYVGGRGRGRVAFGMGMPGGYPMYDQGMAYTSIDRYGYAGYGAGSMMGYGGVPPYGGGVTYPTIDYTGWSARGAGKELHLFNYLLCYYGF